MFKYITYLSNDRDYKGALLLNHMLKKLNSMYSLECIVLENVSDKIISILNTNEINIHKFNLKNILNDFGFDDNFSEYLVSKNYYGKYLIFSLTMYEKIVYLDTDLLLKSGIDELFDFDCNNNEMYMTYDTLINRNHDLSFYTKFVNSGVIVCKPNTTIYEYCYNSLKYYKQKISELNTDQTIFNEAMKNNNLLIKYLPYKYNCVHSVVSELLNANIIDEVKIIHFILSPKPWDYIDNSVMGYYYSNNSNYFMEWINLYFEMVKENTEKSFSKNIYRNYNSYLLKDECEIKSLEKL